MPLSSETLATTVAAETAKHLLHQVGVAVIASALAAVAVLWLAPIIYLSQRLARANQKIDDGLTAVRQEPGTTNPMISALYLHLLEKPVPQHPAATIETP